MAFTSKGRIYDPPQVIEVTLTGQTEVTVETDFGNILFWQYVEEPATTEVPFYKVYARKADNRSGRLYVWCSDTAVTDKVLLRVEGTL